MKSNSISRKIVKVIANKVVSYIEDIYSKLVGKVVTNSWESNPFKFLKGVFQCDPLSGTIFLIVFNPLIEYIKTHKNTQGYKLGNTPIITTPFADDFNLISNNNVKHRKLVADIESKATCDLSFKPNKCRSLSLVSGKPTDIVFYLSTQTPINSVITHPHKFLGSSITRPHAHQVTTYHT